MQEQLLKILKNATAQKPMPFDELLQKSNANAATVQGVLDAMYSKIPYLVNRAVVTRSGIESVVYWPTGHVEKATRQHIVINRSYAPTQQPFSGSKNNPPRRSERPTPPPVVIEKKEEIMIVPKAGTTALSILRYIEDHPNCLGTEIAVALSLPTVSSYIKGYIKAGNVISTPIDKGNRKSGVRYKLADGYSVRDAHRQGDVAVKLVEVNKNATKTTESATEIDKSATEMHESATNVHKSVAEEQVPTFGYAKPVIEKTAEITFPAPTADWGKVEAVLVGEEPRVRFAITSEHTLIIQGKNFEDIELSPKDTEALVEFIESIAMTIPAHNYKVGGASL